MKILNSQIFMAMVISQYSGFYKLSEYNMEAQNCLTVCITYWIKLILDFLYRNINFSKILIKIFLCMLETNNPLLHYFLYIKLFFFKHVIQCFIIFCETFFIFILILKRFNDYFIICFDKISSMRIFLFDAG